MNPLSVFIASILCTSQLAVAHKVFLFNKEIDLSAALAKSSSRFSFVAQAPDEQCVQETEQLASDSGIVTATNNLESTCSAQQEQDGNSFKLSVDYGTCSQLGRYQLACTSAGGKVESAAAFSLECSVYNQGQTKHGSLFFKNIPACLGASCEGNLDQFISNQQFQQETASALENAFASKCIIMNLSSAGYVYAVYPHSKYLSVVRCLLTLETCHSPFSLRVVQGTSANCSVGTSSPAPSVILSKLALVGGLVALLANTL